MSTLLASFNIPWQLWVIFGFIIGGILFNKAFRKEMDALVAHMLGLERRRRQ